MKIQMSARDRRQLKSQIKTTLCLSLFFCLVISASLNLRLYRGYQDLSHFYPDYVDYMNDENKKLRITASVFRAVIQKFVDTLRHHKFKLELVKFGEEMVKEYDKGYSLNFYIVKLENENKELKERIKKYEQQIGNKKIVARSTRNVIKSNN